MTASRNLLLGLGLLALGACSAFGDKKDETTITGERISVLQFNDDLKPDAKLADSELVLPEAWSNKTWPQAGGFPSHAMGHLSLAGGLSEAWKSDIGKGSTRERRLNAQPIVVDGVVYALDTRGELTALDIASGKRLWRVDLAAKEDDGAIGGGVSFGSDRLYATNGYGDVMALGINDGQILWRKSLPAPVRGAPTVAGGRVYVVTLDNQLYALGASDGAQLWRHSGIVEEAGFYGSPSPAVRGNVVIVTYSSGEVFALRVENGRVLWSDNLGALRRTGPLSALADIRGKPVIDGGMVFAVSHGGRMIAIDERTGQRVWQRQIGGIETPWVAGGYIYVLTNEAQLVAMNRNTGEIRWVAELPRWEDPEDHDDPIVWMGPVLAGGRLLAAGSNGQVAEVDPASGAIIDQFANSGGVAVSPTVADDTLLLLTVNGSLTAWR